MIDFDQLSDEELIKIARPDIETVKAFAAKKYGVPMEIGNRLIKAESSGNQSAVSPKGAIGRTQLMPKTAKGLGRNPYDEIDNILGGFQYLREQKDKFGSWHKALWAYNAGPKRVKHGFMPEETQGYLGKFADLIGPSTAQAAEIPQRQAAMPPSSRSYAQSQYQEEDDVESMQETQQQDMDLDSMSPEQLAEIAGVNLDAMSPEELAGVAGVTLQPKTQQTEIKSSIPENAPEWAKNNPKAYWKIVDGIKATELAGDVGALTAGSSIGAKVGAAAGIPTGGIASPILALLGGVAGAGVAYAMKEQGMDRLKEYLGMKPETDLTDTATKAATDLAKGSAYELTGQGVGRLLGAGMGKVGNVVGPAVKSAWGNVVGGGRGAIDEAFNVGNSISWKHPFKSITDFDAGMRGAMDGKQLVKNALDAARAVRDKRATEYIDRLARIKTNPAGLNAVRTDVENELSRLVGPDEFQIGVSMTPTGKVNVDFSQSPLVKNLGVVKKAITDVKTWGDNSAAGLDTLKKRLSTYIDQTETGGPAEAMLTRLKESLNNGLKRTVPEYAEMTKGYSELTDIIKDIEAGLMLRKEGMSGRVYADMTLRRLVSSMKDNFILRRDLVEILGNISGDNLKSQIAGYIMRSPVPLGASGGVGPVLTEALLIKLISPKMWPILLASSPRVAGEFLRLYGKAYGDLSKMGPVAGRILVDAFVRNRDIFKDFKLENIQEESPIWEAEQGPNLESSQVEQLEQESQPIIRNKIPSSKQTSVRQPIRIGRDRTNGRVVHDYGNGEIVYAA